MKIRTGFVSNSSSSSFIVIGNKIKYYEVREEDVKNEKIYLRGSYSWDGEDFFVADQEMVNIMQMMGSRDFEVYKVHKLIDGCEKISKSDLPVEPVDIFPIDIDYHITQDINEFKERYYSDED